jgi:hypothetical protein
VTTTSDPERAGASCPLDAFRRAAAEGGVGLQRDLADEALTQLDRAEDHRRRARLSSHYAAVRAVDQLETAHPDDEASLDPLYDGVGRTFEVLTDLDDRAGDAAVSAVETAAAVSERLTRRVLEPRLDLG